MSLTLEPTAPPRVRRPWLALVAMIPAVLVVGLDVTVLSVALPTLSTQLNATTEQLQWLVMAYTITFAAGFIPFGLLGDRFGRRRLFLIALLIFGAGSLWCALSASAASLIAARALLGIGAAGIATVSVAIVNVLFDAAGRGRALTVIIFTNVIGFPLGPVFGGWLLQHVAWGWIFFINVPIVVASLVAVALVMPETRAVIPPHIDAGGLVSATAAIIALCFGFTKAGSTAWASPLVWGPLLAGVTGVAVFVVIERTVRYPAVPLSLFRTPAFAGGALATAALSFVIAGLLFIVPQYTTAILRADTLTSGLYLLPFAIGMALTMPFTGTLGTSIGPVATIALGLGVLTAALAVALATVRSGSGSWLIGWALLVGVAFGLGLSTAMDLAIGAVKADLSGVGSAVLQSVRQLGTALGIALLGSLLVTGYQGALPAPLPDAASEAIRSGVTPGLAMANRLGRDDLASHIRAAFVSGTSTVWTACLAVSVLSAVVAVVAAVRRLRLRAA